MALLLSTALRLKPEIRLAEAVSQFEASLSVDDKTTFRDQRSQALKSPPGTMDVMRFTAQIDRGLAGKTGRCLGPRFTNFLCSAQQFAALGDVIIGGSQNIIACGVWSVVRMSILATIRHSAYVEDMSMIFMEVGRSSPRYQELALLYSRSKNLQANIHEYFIVVVRFCHDMMNFARKSALAQFASSLNSEATKKTRTDLLRWTGEIERDATILLAKRVEDEAIENSRFRLVSNKLSKSISEQQALARKLRILDECSKYDHETSWKQTRKAGNTSLFTLDSLYQDWKSATDSSTLLYFGKLGCGKSVMMANMVDDLTISVGQDHTPVVYFFIRQDLPESLKARTVIGSLARQLLRLNMTFINVIRDEGQVVDTYLTVQDLVVLLRKSYTSKNRIYLVLDGLDLCDSSDKVEIIDFVRQLQLNRWLLVCVSLRQESAHSVEVVYQDFVNFKKSSLPDNKRDIEEFVEAELARCLRNQTLVLGDARLICKIQDALLSGSRGMFLWVALQIRTLCTIATDNDVLAALEDLPADLTETYRRILAKAQGKRETYQRTILRFILAAQQPFELDEMREALSVTRGDTNWTAASAINDIEAILTSCGCLVQVDEEEKTVRLVHPSVQTYLLQWPNTLRFRHDNDWERDGTPLMDICHLTLAEVIVTYLSYGVLDTQVSTERVQQIPGGHAPARIVESVTTRASSTQRLALKFLAQRKRADFDMGKVIAKELGHLDFREREEFVFQHYAKRWCLHHVVACCEHELGPNIALLLPDLLKRRANTSDFTPWMAFRMAVEHNNERLVDMLLARDFQASLNGRFETRHHDRPISYSLMDFAVCKGNRNIVQMMLPHAHAPILSEIYESSFAICDLVYRGALERLSVVKDDNGYVTKSLGFLPEHYKHICQSGRGILACAIWANNINAVKALLNDNLFWKFLDDDHRVPIVREALQAKDTLVLRLLVERDKFNFTSREKHSLTRYATDLDFSEAVRFIASFGTR